VRRTTGRSQRRRNAIKRTRYISTLGLAAVLFSCRIASGQVAFLTGKADTANGLVTQFTITGNASRQILIRGLGPSLSFAKNALPDPRLILVDANGSTLASNANWKDTQQSAIQATGAAPTNDLESAILITLAPGTYTAVEADQSGSDGLGECDVIDVTPGGGGDALLAGGTKGKTESIGGNAIVEAIMLSSQQQVLIRGLGPSLGVTGSLPDPKMSLFNGNGTVIASDDDWQTGGQQAAIQNSGLAPSDPTEPALIANLTAGNYTVFLQGKNGATGIGSAQIYILAGNGVYSGTPLAPNPAVDFGIVAESMELNAKLNDPTIAPQQDVYSYTALQFIGPHLNDVVNDSGQTLAQVLRDDLGTPNPGSLSFDFTASWGAAATFAQNSGFAIAGGNVVFSPNPADFTLTSISRSHGAAVGDHVSLDLTDGFKFSTALSSANVFGTVPSDLSKTQLNDFTSTTTTLSLGIVHNGNASTTYVGQELDTIYYVGPAPAQLLNISTRMEVLGGEQVLIAGFIVTGTDPKKVIIRGIGPSLKGVGASLSDPTLELHQGNAILATNDNWKINDQTQQSQEADIRATTIPPANDLESAILMTLNPGPYTAILAGKNGGTGVGLVEVYDLAQAANSKLANISSRGFVDTGDNVMIGGLIIGPGQAGNAKVIVRAIGPSLTAVGVQGALADPTLELHDGSGTTIASNDNWKLRPDGSSQQAEIEATTIPPANDLESAIVSALPPGNYTAVVRGKNNSTGVGLVEVYNLQ
jgi:hypothetical protein